MEKFYVMGHNSFAMKRVSITESGCYLMNEFMKLMNHEVKCISCKSCPACHRDWLAYMAGSLFDSVLPYEFL